MSRWRIYYADGSTFDSSMGSPAAAPVAGFICAVGYDETNRRYIMHGWDHYCWDLEAQQWWGMDLMGVFDRLRQGKVYAYKEGRTVTRALFQELMRRAHEDEDFPQ